MIAQRPCIFGEVLFDHFPDGSRVLGGAPFNVAWHLQAFGQSPCFISRVGIDAEGDEVRAAMQGWGMERAGLQSDPVRATGKVRVEFDHGEPVYDIVENCAYDAIDAAVVGNPVPGVCRFLYHGTLALRGSASRRALARLTEAGPQTVFIDVNLREPWWRREQVLELLPTAHWVKLNREELGLLGPASAEPGQQAAAFRLAYDLDGLIVTEGARGAAVHTRDGEILRVSPGRNVDAVDTVGAGDAFSSVMILGLLQDWPLQASLERAQAFASSIVTRRGATVTDPSFYRAFVERWRETR